MRRKPLVSLASLFILLTALLAFPKATEAEEGGGGDRCTSGGPGANSCSISIPGAGSCSVGCNEGFYACCKITWFSGPSCTCIAG
jgi:hypothetical protein